jgi:hypothetical protein
MKAITLISRTFIIIALIFFFFTGCQKSDTSKTPAPNIAPSSFEISITDLKQNTATLSWTEAKDPEGQQISYSVIIGMDTIKRYTELNVQLTNLSENKNYQVDIIASDPQGATTKKTISFNTKPYDTPSAFEISLSKVGGTLASISWTVSVLPDNSPVQYDVYLNDQLVQGNLANTVLNFDFRNLQELTTYTTKVVAKSNFSKTQQSSKSFTTGLNPQPTGLGVEVKSTSYSLAKFTIASATDPEGQLVSYSVFLDNNIISSQLDATIIAGKEYVLRSLLPEKNYKLTVTAKDEGGKSISVETTITTLKQPILVISNKSTTKTNEGFIYHLETGVDYKPSKIILYANGNAINTQPTSSSISGNTISYTYLNSYLPAEGNYNLAANLCWGDDTEKSRTATFDSYSFYNFVSSTSVIDNAKIDKASYYKTYFIYFKNSVVSSDPNYSIIEVVFGTQNVGFSVFRTGPTTGYITGFADSQFAAIDAGPKTGYVIMKDNTGYHKLTFTFSYY